LLRNGPAWGDAVNKNYENSPPFSWAGTAERHGAACCQAAASETVGTPTSKSPCAEPLSALSPSCSLSLPASLPDTCVPRRRMKVAQPGWMAVAVVRQVVELTAREPAAAAMQEPAVTVKLVVELIARERVAAATQEPVALVRMVAEGATRVEVLVRVGEVGLRVLVLVAVRTAAQVTAGMTRMAARTRQGAMAMAARVPAGRVQVAVRALVDMMKRVVRVTAGVQKRAVQVRADSPHTEVPERVETPVLVQERLRTTPPAHTLSWCQLARPALRYRPLAPRAAMPTT
jgi:hypothetical protein